jgi:hypothetical protein
MRTLIPLPEEEPEAEDAPEPEDADCVEVPLPELADVFLLPWLRDEPLALP